MGAGVAPETEVWGWMRISDKVPQAVGGIDFLVAHVGSWPSVSFFKRSRKSKSLEGSARETGSYNSVITE